MLFKLTDQNGYTRGRTQWGPGIVNPPTSGAGPLCSSAWYHAYTDPLLAAFLDPIHGNFGTAARLFSCTGEPEAFDSRPGPTCLKVGARQLTFVEWLPLSKPTVVQRVAFGILCARPSASPGWRIWAEAWFSGRERSADAAAYAARYAAYAAAYAARYAAADAAAYGARYAAYAAADAACYAADASLDLAALARQAMEVT